MSKEKTPEKTVTVAIIGTAGRKEDGKKMSAELFEKMKSKAEDIITRVWGLRRGQATLVSGGAPWADHVAVRLFTESVCVTEEPYAGLKLHMPCGLKEAGSKTQAIDNGSDDWKINPGRTVNALHKSFSSAMKSNTLTELSTAKALGATFTVSDGFHARNAKVAKADRVIAFTWGTSSVKDGGTLHTWNLATTPYKVHVALHTLAATPSSPIGP